MLSCKKFESLEAQVLKLIPSPDEADDDVIIEVVEVFNLDIGGKAVERVLQSHLARHRVHYL